MGLLSFSFSYFQVLLGIFISVIGITLTVSHALI